MWARAITTLLSLALLGTASTRSKDSLRTTLTLQEAKVTNVTPFLPKKEFVRGLSLGADTFMAHVLWFYTTNYFGQEYHSKGNYRWLAHMCDLVTDLDPELLFVTEFCAMGLAWHAHDTNAGINLLNKAIDHHKDNFHLRYLQGFYWWYFKEDLDQASKLLNEASQLPGAPPFFAALSARLAMGKNDPKAAIAVLENMLNTTQDPNLRASIEDDLRGAILARDLDALNRAVQLYQSKLGRSPESLATLVDAGILKEVPHDPFSGIYRYNPETGEVESSTGQKPLRFQGKFRRNSQIADAPNISVKKNEEP